MMPRIAMMNNQSKLDKKSKSLAFLLRHDTKAFEEGVIDEHGWRESRELTKEHGFSRPELEAIVSADTKGRYEWNKPKTKLRAVQGHSIPVDLELEEGIPPTVLYHGTSSRFLGSIMRDGIRKMTRQYVHLSLDVETAKEVGRRHGGMPIVIVIDAKKMVEDGIKFYHSKNGYWLTDYVDYKKYGSYTA